MNNKNEHNLSITTEIKQKPKLDHLVLQAPKQELEDVGEDIAFPLDKGTVIAYGPNIHPEIFERLVKIAEKEEIDYNIEPVPGRTGTDATGIQIAKEGIPTGLISIPLRYMHTPVEVVNMKDMERTVKLMVEFITEFEGLKGGKHA